MTMPPVIRIFFAIDLPGSIKAQIGTYISSLKKSAKTYSIRWSKPENLHITLQFLPEVKTDDLPKIIDAVRVELSHHQFLKSFCLGHPLLFPSPFHPRIIALDLEPQFELGKLSQMVGLAVSQSNYTLDKRPFKAHITLGRLKHPQRSKLEFLQSTPFPEFADVPVNAVSVFRSAPNAEGSNYICLEKIELS